MKIALLAAAAMAVAAPAMAADGPPPGMTPESVVAMSDANKDGAVTKDETERWPAGTFDRADANKDGKVTVDELKADWAANYPAK